MLNEVFTQPIFSFTVCVLAYYAGVKAKMRFNHPTINPLIIAALICIGVVMLLRIPLESFMSGASFISMFLAPATAALALSIYRQLDLIKKNIIPILVGCIVGSVVAITSIILMCRFLGLDSEITASLVPKSITTAIATQVSQQMGGIPAITVAAVITTGIMGTILIPCLMKLIPKPDPLSMGLAIGASAHALGTAKAVELGETEGSLSGIAVVFCGIVTVLISIFLK